MPPKRKTGVQNVDIGGAYKLDKLPETEQAKPQVSIGCGLYRLAHASLCPMVAPCLQRGLAVAFWFAHRSTFVKFCLLSWSILSQEQVLPENQDAETHEEQEDIDAELEALAMECVSFCLLKLDVHLRIVA